MAMTVADGDITPRPDPTRLTTEQLYREILWLRNLLEQRMASIEEAVNIRLRERDERFHQIELALADKSMRLNNLENNTSTLTTRITTVEAGRAGTLWIIGPTIALITLVLGAIAMLADHILRPPGSNG